MKTTNFNKLYNYNFGENPILAHLAFANWMTNGYGPKKNNESFKEWAQKEGFKTFSSTDKKDYFSRILDNTIKIYKFLVPNEEDGYKLDCDVENLETDTINKMSSQYKKAINLVINTWTEKMSDTEANDFSTAFKAMLDFMIKHPEKNDAKKIYQAFATYEAGENFEDYYNFSNDEFLNKIVNTAIPTNVGLNYFKNSKNKYLLAICEDIKNLKENNSKLNTIIFKQLKDTYLSSFDSIEDFTNFIKNNSYDEIARKLQYNYLADKIYKKDFAQFTKVMKALNLSNVQGRTTDKFENKNIINKNDKYQIINLLEKEDLPFTLKETNTYLELIAQDNYTWKKKIPESATLEDATLAEYFVNLKILYLSNLKPNRENFKKLCNTKITTDNYPRQAAGRSVPDMKYDSKDSYTIFETTTYSSKTDLENNEFIGIIRHSLLSDKNNVNIILISNNNDKKTLQSDYKLLIKPALSKQKKKSKFVSLTFEDVKNLTPEQFKTLIDPNNKKEFPPKTK